MHSAPYDVVIAECRAQSILELRAMPEVARLTGQSIGANLSPRVGSIAQAASMQILTLGPNRWLLRMPGCAEQVQFNRINEAIGAAFGMLTIVSDAYVSFTLHGRDAKAVLAMGCPLDFALAAFPIDTCACSVLALGAVVLVRDESGFEMLVDRSHASYFRQWLQAAAGTSISRVDSLPG